MQETNDSKLSMKIPRRKFNVMIFDQLLDKLQSKAHEVKILLDIREISFIIVRLRN